MFFLACAYSLPGTSRTGHQFIVANMEDDKRRDHGPDRDEMYIIERSRCNADIMYRVLCGTDEADIRELDCMVNGIVEFYKQNGTPVPHGISLLDDVNTHTLEIPASARRLVQHYIVFVYLSDKMRINGYRESVENGSACRSTLNAFVRDCIEVELDELHKYILHGHVDCMARLLPSYVDRCRNRFILDALPDVNALEQLKIHNAYTTER